MNKNNKHLRKNENMKNELIFNGWVNNRAADVFVHCHADFNDKQQES